jgi:shikimate dehydrogenase
MLSEVMRREHHCPRTASTVRPTPHKGGTRSGTPPLRLRRTAVLEHLDGASRVYFVVGDPIAQVKAPARMTRGFAERGINAVLVPMHVTARDFDEFMRGAARAQNLDGLVITVPHKLTAARYASSFTPRAQLTGAVNVLRREPDGQWLGETTDGASFVAGIRAAGCAPRGMRALLVGAGGAASPIALELIEAGVAELAIHSRTAGRRDQLIGLLKARHPHACVVVGTADPAGFDLVVNATPAGMRPGDPLPVQVDRLGAGTFVGDVITVPEVTPLLAAARQRGCPTQTGIGMVTAAVGLMLDFFSRAPSPSSG